MSVALVTGLIGSETCWRFYEQGFDIAGEASTVVGWSPEVHLREGLPSTILSIWETLRSCETAADKAPIQESHGVHPYVGLERRP